MSIETAARIEAIMKKFSGLTSFTDCRRREIELEPALVAHFYDLAKFVLPKAVSESVNKELSAVTLALLGRSSISFLIPIMFEVKPADSADGNQTATPDSAA